MNPKLLKVITQPNQSFAIRRDIVPFFYNRWHFHPEIELVHIEKGNGIQFIGDSIHRFKKGDLVLVGSNLPHFWRCDEAYFQNKGLKAIAIVMHFKEDFWGSSFLDLSENKKIRTLLQKANRGLLVTGKTRQNVVEKLNLLLKAQETERIILLLQILHTISHSGTVRPITTYGFRNNPDFKQTERINTIYTYTLNHFKDKISINEVAKVSNISPNSFCRFFKSSTRKTYNNFLQEIRIGHACKLLIENKHNITYICYDSGFNNVTNFYKSFRKITGKTPLEYQKTYINDMPEMKI